MPNYDAYLDRSPEYHMEPPVCVWPLFFYTADLYWFTKLEVRLLQSMHSEIFVTRQQGLAAKATMDASEHYNKVLIDITG